MVKFTFKNLNIVLDIYNLTCVYYICANFANAKMFAQIGLITIVLKGHLTKFRLKFLRRCYENNTKLLIFFYSLLIGIGTK